MRALAIVAALVILGDTLAGASGLPVPGPALGLLALTLSFAWRGAPDAEMGALFDVAAPRFRLFFVPAVQDLRYLRRPPADDGAVLGVIACILIAVQR